MIHFSAPQWFLSLSMLFLLTACGLAGKPAPTAAPTQPPLIPAAGFRFSQYGPGYDPGADYWAGVGQQMAAKFPGTKSQAIWIVSQVSGQGTFFSFPGASDDLLIHFGMDDQNDEALTLFDQIGLDVWLQVEPGNAPVDQLIHIMLDRYSRHPCVIGVGVDVEWYQSYDEPEGKPVTDEVAQAWLAAARSHNPAYRLFLKHWEANMMPPTVREGLYFVDDSQGFASLDEMESEFAAWGRAFAPAPVGFQYGYIDDKRWWGELADPPKDIGDRLLAAIPNTVGLYWVDFTVFQIFPVR